MRVGRRVVRVGGGGGGGEVEDRGQGGGGGGGGGGDRGEQRKALSQIQIPPLPTTKPSTIPNYQGRQMPYKCCSGPKSYLKG